MIPYGRQEITQADIDSVVDVLTSDFLTQGPKVPLFECTLADKVGAKYAVAANSATSALHIACLALELQPGDWLWTSPVTFVASANCGLYCGASIDFVDIDPTTFNLCPKALERKLTQAKKENRLPKIVVVVHLCGQPADLAGIHALSEIYGFSIIEDASHAIGGKYMDTYIGSSIYSDITVFSFHPVKIITTAEGGMAVTNNELLSKKMTLFRSHGITRDPHQLTNKPHGPWYYEQLDLGYNYRMTDIQAALGISQIKRLDSNVEKRHTLAQLYNENLLDLPITLPLQHSDGYSSFHLYVIRLQLNRMQKTHLEVFQELQENGIGVNLHYMPVYMQPFYKSMGFIETDFPESTKYYQEAISLPLYHALSAKDQRKVIDILHKVLNK